MPTTVQGADALIETLPLEDRIRRRASELHVERVTRGNHAGSQLDDWLQAEQEIFRAHQDAQPIFRTTPPKQSRWSAKIRVLRRGFYDCAQLEHSALLAHEPIETGRGRK